MNRRARSAVMLKFTVSNSLQLRADEVIE
jgi:hypothetical protein